MSAKRTLVLGVLCLLFLGLSGPPGLGQTVTSVSIVEKAGVTTTNYPVTVSMVFRKGDVASHVTARVGGQNLQTQTDVKVRWPDNSVKHALVSFAIPSLVANSTALVEFTSGGTNYNTGGLSKTDLLATDFDARMNITPSGGTLTSITARNLLNGIATPEYWVKGSICTEFLIRDFAVNAINNQVNVQFYVRKYPGWNGYRVDTVVENCWTQRIGDVTYDFTLDLGNTNPSTVFAKTAMKHGYNTRWRKVFWLGDQPPTIEVRHDLPYLLATGVLPRYDTNLVVPEATLASAYSGWLASGRDILDNGIITTAMPNTGGRQDIGLYPTWAARYLISMDRRLQEVTLNCGDLSGSPPIHLRESDPARSFYLHVVSINDRRTVWASQPTRYTDANAVADRMTVVGPMTTEWQVDKAHQPSLAYVPYLATGDFYYLEEMYFWAAFDLADSNPGYRQYETGLLRDQVRGEAWAIRNIGDAAHMAPDAHSLEKNYFIQKINNNIASYTTKYVQSSAYPSVHYWGASSNMAYDSGRPDANIDSTCRHYSSPWMDDFVLVAMAHLKDVGFATGGLVDWLGDAVVKRFSHPDYNWNRGAPYHMPVTYNDGNNGGIPYATWADVDNAYSDDVGPSDLPNPDYAFSYTYIARAALSHLLHMPNGETAWNWLDSHIHTKSDLNQDPTWAFLPWVPYPDTVAPATVSNLAASSFTNNSCVLTWTAPGDDSSSGRASLYDIRWSTATITTANWASATQVAGEPAPASAGTSQSMTVTGLPAGTNLYFAIKTSDEVPNTSGLSNVATGATGPAVPPTLQFAATASSDSETTTSVNLTVSLNTSSTLAITVNYAVTGGTAGGGGVDYTLSGTSLTFDPGQTSRTIAITVNNDSLVESNETIVVTLSSPTNATLGANVVHTYTILDDDSAVLPTVQFDMSSSSGSEGTTPANITLSLGSSSDRVVTVDYAVTGGAATKDTDYSLPGSSTFTSVFKRDTGLTTGGALSSQFTGLTSANVVATSVKDAELYNAGTARYYNYGASTYADYYAIVGFDLAACAGATITKAELRIRCSAGNTAISWAGVKSHDWVEGNKTGNFPGSGTAAPGVCPAHPAGLYTAPSGALGWGNNSNAYMDFTGDGADLYGWTNFTSNPSGLAWCVADVTALVQDWCDGDKPNYGLVINLGNHRAYMSEQGTADQPVLFVEYTLPGGRIAFQPGQTTRTIAVTISEDTASEATEDFTLTLSNPLNARLGTRTAHTYSILDNDNLAPSVNAGTDRAITLPGTASLDATVTDDGLPNPPAALTAEWTKVSGPGTVTFGDATLIDTSASFSAAGTYVLQLMVSDSVLSTSDTLTVTVQPMPTVQFAATSASGDEGSTPANLNITLSHASPYPIVVNYAVSGGTATENTDYSLPVPDPVVKVFKRSTGLLTGGALSSNFSAVSASNVAVVAVKDARLWNSGNARYYNYGAGTYVDGFSGNYAIIHLDLSAYAGATINKAELRLRCSTGNTTMQLAGIKSRDWTEGNKTGNYPGASPAAPGVCWAHPAGTYAAPSGTPGWGPAGNTMLDSTANGADLYDWVTFRSTPAGGAWVVADITSLVADWISGAKPNYGLLVNVGNHTTYLSEQSSDYEPALFVDCVLPNHKVTIEPGLTSKTLPISVVNDAASEANETFAITLSSPENGTLGANTTCTYTINDNDGPPAVQFSSASSSGSEATSPANLTVTLSRSSSQTVTVNYKVTGGTAAGGLDYSISGSTGDVIALKRDAGLTTGGALSSQFTSLGAGDVVTSTVKDTRLWNAANSRYYNYGAATNTSSLSSGNYMAVAFDLAAYGAVTINRAELRLRCNAGNTAMSFAGIKSHDWTEGNKTGDYPGLSPAAPGVCCAHPAGTYTTASGALGWGAGSNAFFDFAGNGADLYDWTNFTSSPSGTAWCVADVTSLVRDWAMGSKANYGLVVNLGNHASYLSEQGTADEPVLFLDYTVQGGVLTFTPGQTSQPVGITIVNDALVDPAETIVVTLSSPVNADLGTTTAHTYTINDND